jgi:beta-fructofuranosidase
MNDPNGLFYYQGYYHMFYQYSTSIVWTNTKYWGHAVSKDLVNWKRLPIGLYPDQPGADNYGVWSGSAIVINDTEILAIYTGINEPNVVDGGAQTVCLAYPNSTDGLLIDWYKDTANPVVSGPPSEFENSLLGFRDPTIWRQNNKWYFVLASGMRNLFALTLLYESEDLKHWTYKHPFALGEPSEGTIWECPDYFTLPTPDGSTVDCLFLSMESNGVGWKLGRTDPARMMFLPFNDAYRYDVGWNYAPRSFYDPVKKRRIQFGWMNEGRDISISVKENWAGVMTLPREIYIRDDLTVGFRPIEEQKQLRQSILFTLNNFTFPSNLVRWDNIFRTAKGNQLEFIAKFTISKTASPSDRFGLILLSDTLQTEYTRIFADLSQNQMGYNLTFGSVNPKTDHSVNQLKYPFSDNTLTLHGFVDHSVIEVFVNEQIVLTPRVYPEGKDAVHMGLYYEQVSEGTPSKITLDSLVVYSVGSIWD